MRQAEFNLADWLTEEEVSDTWALRERYFVACNALVGQAFREALIEAGYEEHFEEMIHLKVHRHAEIRGQLAWHSYVPDTDFCQALTADDNRRAWEFKNEGKADPVFARITGR